MTQHTTYKEAGVDIAKADTLIDSIKHVAKRTYRPGVLAGIGGFGALFEIPTHYKQPVLVSGTDGVGTKLKLALELNRHDTIGFDLVAMCANDIICSGADPLFFLDYYATGKLNLEQAKTVITGIGQACEAAGCSLIGGETAEMPGMYQDDDYDLAGFCVGVVEKSKIIDGSNVQVGDAILGIHSSGPHSNGYSLIRYLIDKHHIDIHTLLDGQSIADHLMTPTRIYAHSIHMLAKQINIHALAHITGGGLLENIPRILPQNTQASLIKNSWTWPVIFNWLQELGNITFEEMVTSFNVGIGMVLIIKQDHVQTAIDTLTHLGETVTVIGEITSSSQAEPRVVIE